MNQGLKASLVLFFLSSSVSLAHLDHEEIVKRFTTPEENSERSMEEKFFIPSLEEVIPSYIQKRIRSKPPQIKPTFDGLSERIDLRHRDTPIKKQIGGRCSAYGLIASIENLLGAPEVAKLSESHLWSEYRKYSSMSAVYTAKHASITEYQKWPAERKTPLPGWEEKRHTLLENITFIEDDVTKALQAINEGRPVYIGMSVTSSMMKCDAVLDSESPDTGGGHAVSISGYALDKRVAGGGYFLIKNSWGEHCGDKGYQYLPFSYCLRGGSSYCIMWDVQGVKTSFPGVPSVVPKVPDFDLSRIKIHSSSYRPWYSWNRVVRIEIEGDSLHAKQIKDVSYAIDDGNFGNPIKNDIDTVYMSFTTKSEAHDINLKIRLHNGQVIETVHKWRM